MPVIGPEYYAELRSVENRASPGQAQIDMSHPLIGAILLELMRLRADGYDVNDAEIARHAIREAERADRRREKFEARLEAVEAQPVPGEYVYYMELRDTVKIGFSTNPERRKRELVADRIIAVEPGSKYLEALRHQQFAEFRLNHLGYERYRNAPELLSHAQSLWEKHGRCWLAEVG